MQSQHLNRSLFSALFLGTNLLGCAVFEAPINGATLDVNGSDADVASDGDGDGDAIDEEVPDAKAPSHPSDAGGLPDAQAADDASEPGPDAMMTSCVVPALNLMDDCANSDIVINEIDGSGEDFVEIYNRGNAPVNVSGYVITDDSAGAPAVAEGAVIPAGTVLDPKRFLYLWANLPPETEPNPGVFFQNCVPGTPSPCLHSEWGISAGGERIYLLNDKLEVICAVTYNGVYGGEALGRIPDGSSALCPTNPTAGESNVVSTLR